MTRILRALAPAWIASAVLACGGAEEIAIEHADLPRLELSSPAFGPGDEIPREHTCDGLGASPPLAWSPGPMGTSAYALAMEDPDAPMGTWVHWIAWNLTATELAASQPAEAELQGGARQGRNSWKKPGYGGPCPPDGRHRYVFRVYALDVRLDLSAEEDEAALLRALDGHVLAEGQLVGTYARP